MLLRLTIHSVTSATHSYFFPFQQVSLTLKSKNIEGQGNIFYSSEIIVKSSEMPEMRAVRTCKFSECDYKNRSLSRMRLHEQMHSNDPEVQRPYKCVKCAYRASTAVHLRNHAVVHSDETPFACSMIGCGFRTNRKRRLKDHEKWKHSLQKPFKCTTEGCGFETTTRRNLERHVLSLHTDLRERRIECPLCSQKFFTFGKMQRHLATHTIEKPYQCSFCSFESSSKTSWSRHCETQHGQISVSHEQVLRQCNLCEFKTKCFGNLKRHLALHSMHSPEKFPCTHPECDYVAKSKRLLTTHYLQTHVKPFVCLVPNCKNEFSTEVALLNHQKIHDPKRPYQCDVCKQRYGRKSDLSSHIMTVHSKARQFHCHICDYSAKRRTHVSKHIQRIHKTGLIECKEDGCSFQTCSPYGIIQHNKRHSVNRQFKCENCNGLFSYRRSLLRHMRKSCGVLKEKRSNCGNLETHTTVSGIPVPLIDRQQKSGDNPNVFHKTVTVVLSRIVIGYR